MRFALCVRFCWSTRLVSPALRSAIYVKPVALRPVVCSRYVLINALRELHSSMFVVQVTSLLVRCARYVVLSAIHAMSSA